ncbi:hypothetical protein [Mycobacteroides abscessus]|uniref:hypothetical protein n=1 Tax=Mycobacteroides abscessus TaxID=36809 RepID=UPI0005DA77DB|nr:hypothetical protein [Mycobacteroides abscessus]CPW66977.1 Uncharacterised protein [Mycobacteroides abscessus]SKF61964.1 Uncharacterised protein [Mycobacteroides abscessus subsp. bolletii]SKH89574.1 Uncharacterised protein [Mycobacteroides abscessus subsp. bolletii]
MSDPLDRLAELASGEIEAVWTAAAFTTAEAVGLWVDDPANPHVVVAVYDQQIVHIEISDAMLRVPLEQLQDVLNMCIFNAFAMWRSQVSAPATITA